MCSARSTSFRAPVKCASWAMAARAAGSRRRCRDSRPHCYSPLRCRPTSICAKESHMKNSSADVIREYGPFEGIEKIHGVSFDGEQIWVAGGDALSAIDPATGKKKRSLNVAAHAGTAFDGQHLFQISEA